MEVEEFLAMTNEQRGALVVSRFGQAAIKVHSWIETEPRSAQYPSWQVTGNIIEHLRPLGFNIQVSMLEDQVNVNIYSYVGEESCLKGHASLTYDRGAKYWGKIPYEDIPHNAVAIAALMTVGAIELPPDSVS